MKTKIGHFATSDIDNFGDILYRIVIEAALRRVGIDGDFQSYAFLSGRAPCHGGYGIKSIQPFLNRPGTQKDLFIVGGGDILHANRAPLAHHYQRIVEARRRKNPWLRIRDRIAGWEFDRDEFVRDHMTYDSVGPFVLDRTCFPGIKKLAYLSCGVPFGFDDTQADAVRAAFESACFVYFRDRPSLEKIESKGVSTQMYCAPDIIVTLSDFFNKDTLQRRGREILNRAGLTEGKRVLCFQCQPPPEQFIEPIMEQLKILNRDQDYEIALVPTGFCHGDHTFLENVASLSGGQFKYVDIHSIFDIIAVIAAVDFFAGTSLHGNVSAFSLGVSHLFGRLEVDKIGGFLDMTNLDHKLAINDWKDLASTVEWAAERDQEQSMDCLRVAKNRVYELLKLLREKMETP